MLPFILLPWIVLLKPLMPLPRTEVMRKISNEILYSRFHRYRRRWHARLFATPSATPSTPRSHRDLDAEFRLRGLFSNSETVVALIHSAVD